VIIAYDDSDGWYDHVMPPLLYPSKGPDDALNGPGQCGEPTSDATLNRCGYGPRLVLLAISPYARRNAVDHTQTDQASILKFIEDNWRLPRVAGSFDSIAGPLTAMFNFGGNVGHNATLFVDPTTGQVIH
jgi:phospholipase C